MIVIANGNARANWISTLNNISMIETNASNGEETRYLFHSFMFWLTIF